ncbi:hypothetical protein AB447_208980 [Bacillus glycinifermentans]|uniref:Uncharacterized protein n=1 Tax=Bacillus glycinifermentans TaxID=1664069 RepID=A0A0T6BIA0_9BACI|nr:hypothetical protein AB447_208980 [Bacillus glycinifermentans]
MICKWKIKHHKVAHNRKSDLDEWIIEEVDWHIFKEYIEMWVGKKYEGELPKVGEPFTVSYRRKKFTFERLN